MKRRFIKYIVAASLIFSIAGCKDLSEININPNGVDPSRANVNLMLPGLLSSLSGHYAILDNSLSSGIMQHMQEDGWFDGYNHYRWDSKDWGEWYEILANNDVMLKVAVTNQLPMHEGIGLVVRAFAFGVVTDLWGDAPYTEAIKANEQITQPKFDGQETIYKGILADLQRASELFQAGNTSGIIANNDLIYKGDIKKWHQFANSMLLRYAMRLSEKMPNEAAQIIKRVYDSGVYLSNTANNASVNYLGNTSGDSYFLATQFDADGSIFRRRKVAKTIMDLLIANKDPRLTVWVSPVHCQWVEDLTLSTAYDAFVRKNNVPQSYNSLTFVQYQTEIAAGHKFTRHYNPNILGYRLDTAKYVGVPAGSLEPSSYNLNPTPGQIVQNQHVSQLSAMYRQPTGTYLKRRLATTEETYFILAEAAQRGWIGGNAETLYNEAIKASLTAWGVPDKYAAYIAQPNVKYKGTLEQIIQQKWVASWNCATESWMDFRRTGFPKLVAGPASPETVLPVRFIYGNNEINANRENLEAAIEGLQETPYSKVRGKNSQWSKPWILQGTNKPW